MRVAIAELIMKFEETPMSPFSTPRSINTRVNKDFYVTTETKCESSSLSIMEKVNIQEACMQHLLQPQLIQRCKVHQCVQNK